VYEVKESGDGFYHGGDVDQVIDANGNSTSPAEVIMEVGDSFKFFHRVWYNQTHLVHFESMLTSAWNVGNSFTGQGFPKVVEETLRQKTLTNRLRRGGQMQLGTRNNQIADFTYDDFVDLPELHGVVTGLQLVGFVLKVLQSHRVWSIYIYRTSSFNPDGTESILLTDQVFGTRRPDSQEWGTQDPESVAVHERHMYFWDRSKGLIIRDSANGLFPISSYKMVKYFRDLSADLDSDYKCRVGFNETYDEVYFCFYKFLGAENRMVIFNENENRLRWTHEFDFGTGYVMNLGSRFFTLTGRNIYAWNTGSSSYGTVQNGYRDPYLEFVVNIDPEKVKRWRALAMHASHKFYAPNDGDILTPASDNYSLGMQTRLLENLVQSKEGVWYAPIMNDTNTPGSGTTEENVVNGRPLRGQTLKVKLSLDGADYVDEYVNLEGVKVMYTDSEKS
jgi:hypothetical protein